MQFLVIYNRATGKSEVRAFQGDSDGLMNARFDAERSAGPDVEVATLNADSVDELKATHSRYFSGADAMFSDLERLIAS